MSLKKKKKKIHMNSSYVCDRTPLYIILNCFFFSFFYLNNILQLNLNRKRKNYIYIIYIYYILLLYIIIYIMACDRTPLYIILNCFFFFLFLFK